MDKMGGHRQDCDHWTKCMAIDRTVTTGLNELFSFWRTISMFFPINVGPSHFCWATICSENRAGTSEPLDGGGWGSKMGWNVQH